MSMRGIFWFIVLGLCLSSCKTHEVIKVVPDVHYKDRVQLQQDSVHVHDSVFSTIYVRGDTVFAERYKYKYKIKYRLKYDTVSVRDSIPYPVEVVKYRTKKNTLPWWLLSVMFVVLSIVLCRRS